MNILDKFRQNRNTFVFARLLAASTFLTSLASCGTDGEKSTYRHSHTATTQKTKSNNMALQEKALKKNYHGIWTSIGGRGGLNKHLVQMSGMHNNVRNLYGIDNVEKLNVILEKADHQELSLTDAAIKVIRVFEGTAKKSYNDNLGLRTAFDGALLPAPDSKDARIKLICKAGGIKNYKKFYAGQEKVSSEASYRVTSALLEGKGGFFDQLDKTIDKAIDGKDGYSAEAMKPCHKLMLLSMIYQCPTTLTIDREATNPLLVQLCKDNPEPEDEEQAEEAMQDLITHYEDAKLLKLPVSAAFKHARNTLLNRGKMLHAAAMGDADAPMTVESIAKQLNAMQRDQKGNMIAILVGKMPEGATLKDILQDPNCGFKQSTQATIVLPLLGVKAVKEKNADYFDLVRIKENPDMPNKVDISKTCIYSDALLAQNTVSRNRLN